MRPMAERKAKRKSRWGWWLLVIVIIVVLVVAVPNLFHKYLVPQPGEASHVSALRTICTANVQFQYTHPKQGYARSLKELGDEGYIDKALASGEKSGYRFEYVAGKPDKDGLIEEYHITARPLRYGTGWNATGKNSIYSDESCDMHINREDRAPTKNDPPLS